MQFGRLFNTCTFQEYKDIFENSKNYEDFNILGIYRSLLENEGLTVNEKIEIKNLYNTEFGKTYNFLQIKDPMTYMHLELLGKNYTKADAEQLYKNIQTNQEKILKEKRIKHRNFGTYSKHLCYDENCPMFGMMIQQGSLFMERAMQFPSDNRFFRGVGGNRMKSDRLKKERKNKKFLKEILQDLG